MDVVGINEENPNGIVFPVKNVSSSEDSIFPAQEYDWDDIEKRLYPLVVSAIKKIDNNAAVGD